jgi:hypothetical protein
MRWSATSFFRAFASSNDFGGLSDTAIFYECKLRRDANFHSTFTSIKNETPIPSTRTPASPWTTTAI